MVYTVAVAFDAFFAAINLPGDHRGIANTRKDWIVGRLGASLNILDSFTMGSIPRFTALKEHADLDVMVILHFGQHIDGRRPSSLLSLVKSALGYGAGSIRRNGQAVTMRFSSWPDVDVVPASRVTNNDGSVAYYKIPDMNREEWIKTKPATHSQQIAAASSAYGENFRRVIKMIKDWNRRQEVSLQSYHLEVIALKVGNIDWNDTGYAIYKWLEKAESSMKFLWHQDSDVTAYLPYDRAARAIEQVRKTKGQALDAWYSTYGDRNDHRKAITIWKSIFGAKFPSYG
ncbi:nucleotidyltransferase [Kitasatospora sp. NBC_00240]|uniref:nucleotidyltransferase n=1 Tax=Kitasatospora sp. NBC_00240 TaxID=2903567 RepID=UPI00224E42AE|nr:nucleotidyltransferase [Kitasatospora sp. NBC_00240]MCX5213152.1 nucleotidyltransferase [Kitasatospora sp. NBC_00240]